MFTNHKSDQGLVSRIHREPLQLNNKKKSTPCFKWSKNLNRHVSKEDMQNGQKHMKRCSLSLVIGETQIRTTVRCHFTPIRVVLIEETDKCRQEKEKSECSSAVGGNVNGAAALDNSLGVPPGAQVSYDPEILLLGTCSSERKRMSTQKLVRKCS